MTDNTTLATTAPVDDLLQADKEAKREALQFLLDKGFKYEGKYSTPCLYFPDGGYGGPAFPYATVTDRVTLYSLLQKSATPNTKGRYEWTLVPAETPDNG